MTEQKSVSSWIDKELTETQTSDFGERLPALKLETGKITSFAVEVTGQPFAKWQGDKGTKALIPVIVGSERRILWLNVKNPLYHQILTSLKAGNTNFKVFTTGSQDKTRYELVKE